MCGRLGLGLGKARREGVYYMVIAILLISIVCCLELVAFRGLRCGPPREVQVDHHEERAEEVECGREDVTFGEGARFTEGCDGA